MDAKTQNRLHQLQAALHEAKENGDWERADRIQLYIDEII